MPQKAFYAMFSHTFKTIKKKEKMVILFLFVKSRIDHCHPLVYLGSMTALIST